MYSIVPQETKDGCVDIKQIQAYPVIDKHTGKERLVRTSATIFRVLYAHDKAQLHEQWKLVYTKHGYNFTCPDRMVKEGIATDHTLTRRPGIAFGKGKATSGSMSEGKARAMLTKQVGESLANYIMGLFSDAIFDHALDVQAARKAA